jgi:dihydrofolate synthase/folylpolyglutamate synthase
MTIEETIRSHLFSLATRGIKYDLDRMSAAARRLGDPQDACPCFHVAGTNGKGSVCAYLESALRSCGLKTGLFTSPHLVDFEERFMINGRPIDSALWVEVYGDIRSIIDEMELTFFEATTLMAFELFRREKVAWAGYETGLGGRLDATNLVVPRVSIITHIAMDHMDYLGDNLASIAGEKLGIVKKRVPLVMAEPEEPAVRTLAEKRCREMETTCTFASQRSAQDVVVDDDGVGFRWKGRPFRADLRGAYQLINALTALEALSIAGFTDQTNIAIGIERATLPGRFQVQSIRGRTVVFDVGHNPDAAQAFCNALQKRFPRESVCVVTGVMKDKDISGILAQYGRIADRIILSRPSTDRAASMEDLEQKMPATFKGSFSSKATIAAAIEAAFGSPEDCICVAGSFFTVGEAMQYLGVKPFPQPIDLSLVHNQ